MIVQHRANILSSRLQRGKRAKAGLVGVSSILVVSPMCLLFWMNSYFLGGRIAGAGLEYDSTYSDDKGRAALSAMDQEPWPKPNGWESMGFHDVRKHFKCKAYAHDQTKPLPT